MFGTSQRWVHIIFVHPPVTQVTPSEGLTILLPFLRAEHTCCLTAAILDFAKGAFFEVNRGKNHTLYLYLPELLICVKGITEVVFYFVLSFTVKEGSKKGLKKERRPVANRQLLYQSSLLPHFLPHGATITKRKEEHLEVKLKDTSPQDTFINLLGTVFFLFIVQSALTH